ncbi:unnamed protein product [Aphanomyces euteiches]
MAEDDPVVREIPVHLADILRGNMYALNEFPLRPVYRAMTNAPVQAKYKPVNAMLTLDYPVTMDEHYNKDDNLQMPQRLQLQSTAVAPVSNYAVGVFRGGQLHLTPVSSVLQMRPTMSHLDDNEDEEMEVDDKPEKKSSNTTTGSNVEEIQVQFKKRQSERAIAAMQNTYAYRRGIIESEEWVHLNINPTPDDEFEQLFSEFENPIAFDMSPTSYLRTLSYRENEPGPSITEEIEDDKMEGINSTVDDKVLAVLQTYKVVAFKTLVDLLPSSIAEDEVRASLARVATTIRGSHLPKSSLLKDHVEYRTAIVKEFEKSSSVSRNALIEKYKMPPALAKTLLSEYATLDPQTRLWRLKAVEDV